MERSKWVLWVVVLAAAGVIVWRVGFHTPKSDLSGVAPRADAKVSPAAHSLKEPAGTEAPAGAASNASSDVNAPAEPNASREGGASADANAPAEPNQPIQREEPNRPQDRDRPGETARPPETTGADKAKPAEPNAAGEQMEAVNLKDVEMKNIIDKIAQWTGKTVIPHDDAMKQKVTIYAPEKLPRKKALEKIYSALRMKGFMAEEVDDTIFLKPLTGAKLGVFPTVGPDEPLAVYENKDQIVQKLFKLTNYPPSQMGTIVQPLVGEYGHVSADATTGTLLVIDTVGNLMRIEHIISQFDVPEAGKAVTEIIEIRYGDPSEIVQLLRMLLGESMDSSRYRRSYGGRVSSMSRPSSPSGSPSGSGSRTGAATSVTIPGGDIPIILIPEPTRKWIIVSGSTEDVKKIRDWVEKLDREDPVRSEYETVSVSYADPEEVTRRIEEALDELPGAGLRPSVVVQPLQQSRQIMIFGRAELRDMVKQLILEVDIPPGTYETKHFQLKHADPEQIKTNLDNLYGENVPRYDSYSYYRYGAGSRRTPADTVKVIAFPGMQQLTVIAAPENMRKIEKQIEEWDVPLDVEAVKPRIIELKNSDPVQMADLLGRLFSEDQDSSSSSFLRYILFGGAEDQRRKIVGPLYGQLTFEEVPGTKKIIVISKIPQAYDVVEQLIYDLDREEMAEIPHVVQIKYADTEDLAERLNAMFNEPGTNAPIRRTTQGLSEYSMDDEQGGQNQGGSRDNNSGGGPGGGNTYTPWWSAGARRTLDEEPISNVIGRVRFVPDPRSKTILVLAPPEFHQSLEETMRTLDVPGRQVMVKAIVVEVDHRDLTSLGVQLSSNPLEVFGNLGENAVTALSQLTYLDQRGSTTVGVDTDITVLLDFLIKTVNAQILNQQTLWTEDNEEASLFKGDRIAFQTNFSESETGGRITTNFEFQKVGMTLAVRPSITPEKNVDMNVTVLMSQLSGEVINGQPVRRVMETTTNMIVSDGQTLMLGGILFQTDTKTVRKIPLLGDAPLVGPLFRHYGVTKANNELIIFITPYVIDDGQQLPGETVEEILEPKQKLDNIRGELDAMSSQLEEKVQEK